MNKELVEVLRRRIASTSVGVSTARRMGPKGTIKTAREYLAGLDLADFTKKTEREFRGALNNATRRFIKHLPRGARHWGAARKFLNIFLRSAVYNRFLCECYNLYRIERWLEVPLDSHVAKGLRGEEGGKILPRWKTVIGLDQSTNRKYQEFAAEVARRHDTNRVHLDVLYYRREFVAANTSFHRLRETSPQR